MPTLAVTLILPVLLLASTLTVSVDAANTTQFDNFTIEWENFSLFTCSSRMELRVSLFTCKAPRNLTMDELTCLNETTFDFNDTMCQITTTTTTTSTTTTTMTTTTTSTTTTTTTSATTTTTTTATTVTTATTATTASTTTVTTTQTPTNGSTLPSAVNTTAAVVVNTTVAPQTSTHASNTTTSMNTTMAATGSTSSNTTRLTTLSTTSATSATTATMISTTGASVTGVSGGSGGSSTTASSRGPYDCDDIAYIGVSCNVSANPCDMSQPCINSATCFPNNTLPLGYWCLCQQGYEGVNCEKDDRACKEGTCWHNGSCTELNSTTSANNSAAYQCECAEGYDGPNCLLRVNLCENVTCENNGICQTVEMKWKCLCLDTSLFYGDYCQFKTTKLRIKEILSKSFASIAIAAIVTTCTFIVIMDILKYAFHIDPVEQQRESYRKRREERRRARRAPKNVGLKVALRFQYVT